MKRREKRSIFQSYKAAWAAVCEEDISNEEQLDRLTDVWAQVAEEHSIRSGEVAMIINECEDDHREYLNNNFINNVGVICSNCGHGTNAETRRKFDGEDDCMWCGCRAIIAACSDDAESDIFTGRQELNWSQETLDEHMRGEEED